VQLDKSTSNASILNIYDTYGLDVTYAFLEHIYQNKYYESYQTYLSVYLEGSYYHLTGSIIQLNTDSDALVFLYFTLIILELFKREQKKIKLHYDIDNADLPIELLSKITDRSKVGTQ
ncbi:Hypothetical protein POVR2_LOCUS213, partial [uncultured virus]